MEAQKEKKPQRGSGRRGQSGDRGQRKDKEFEQKVIDLARVTRVVAGGKRMRFRACVVIGDQKSRVGFGIAKGADVTSAVTKAVTQAKKRLITVPTVNNTIPHAMKIKFKSAVLLMKPAPLGSGVIAGGAVRDVLNMAGVRNVVCKMMGTQNKINNVRAIIKALSSFRVDSLEKLNKQ